jgi:hypothetical protein
VVINRHVSPFFAVTSYVQSVDEYAVPEVAACVNNTDDPTIPCNSEYSYSWFADDH